MAARVFGRSSSFDPGQDAVVRVYMHKLRKKLEAIYAGPRRHAADQVAVPLGEYRLILASALERDEGAAWRADPAPVPSQPPWRQARKQAGGADAFEALYQVRGSTG